MSWTSIEIKENYKTPSRIIAKILRIIAFGLILVILGLNIFWVVGITNLRFTNAEEPVFYTTTDGIGLNFSMTIKNDASSASNIKDVALEAWFYNSTGSLIMYDIIPAFDIDAGSVETIPINLFTNFTTLGMEISPDLFMNQTVNESDGIILNLFVSFTYGFYTLHFEVEFNLQNGGE